MKANLVLSVIALGCALSFGGMRAEARSIVCESVNGNSRTCPANTGDGVRLSVQYSKASCRRGSSWGTNRRGIWVSNGCRAQFDLGNHRTSHRGNSDSTAAAVLALGIIGAVAIAANHDRRSDRDRDRDRDRHDHQAYRPNDRDRDYGPERTLTCESRDRDHRYCDARIGRGGRVEIERQLSKTECRFNRNWGWDRRGIWVADGCRARFGIY